MLVGCLTVADDDSVTAVGPRAVLKVHFCTLCTTSSGLVLVVEGPHFDGSNEKVLVFRQLLIAVRVAHERTAVAELLAEKQSAQAVFAPAEHDVVGCREDTVVVEKRRPVDAEFRLEREQETFAAAVPTRLDEQWVGGEYTEDRSLEVLNDDQYRSLDRPHVTVHRHEAIAVLLSGEGQLPRLALKSTRHTSVEVADLLF